VDAGRRHPPGFLAASWSRSDISDYNAREAQDVQPVKHIGELPHGERLPRSVFP